MKNIFIISLAFILSISLVFAGDWPMFGSDALHSGKSSTSFTPEYNEYSDAGLVNEINLGGRLQSTPVIVGDMLYVNGDKFHIFNMTSGKDISFQNSDINPLQQNVYYIFSTPAYSNGKVCYNDYYNAYCRDGVTGKLLWQFNETRNGSAGSYMIKFEHASPIISNGKVWIAPASLRGPPQNIYAFNLSTGNILISKEIFDQYYQKYGQSPEYITTPAISNGKVYFSTRGAQGYWGQVYGIDENTGEEIWHYDVNQTDGYMENNPVTVSGENVIVGVHNDYQGLIFESYLLVLNKNDGGLVRKIKLPEFKSLEDFSPIVYAGKVFVAADNRMLVSQYEAETTYQSKIYAFELATGNLVWESQATKGLVDSFSIADSKIMISVGSDDPREGTSDIYALSTVNGNLLWSKANVNLEGYAAAPSIVNDKVYFATSGGRIREFVSKTSGSTTTSLSTSSVSTLTLKESDVVIEVTGKGSTTGSVSVSKYLGSVSGEVGVAQLNKYVDITADKSILDNMLSAVIKIYYTDDEVKELGINESSLKLYTVVDGKVITLLSSGVNTVENYVYGTTTSFSSYGSAGNLEDGDSDNVADSLDNCVNTANTGQEDNDLDGVGDECDNCADVSNSGQKNSDSDSAGDACDSDDDDDGVVDEADNCRIVDNYGQQDSDSDGVGDACDNCVNTDNAGQQDSDSDNVGDSCDRCSAVKGANSDNALNNLNDFKTAVVDSVYANSVKNPLKSNINGAIGALERGQSKNAISKLDAVISTAERLYGRGKIAQGTKDGVVQCANGIKAQI